MKDDGRIQSEADGCWYDHSPSFPQRRLPTSMRSGVGGPVHYGEVPGFMQEIAGVGERLRIEHQRSVVR